MATKAFKKLPARAKRAAFANMAKKGVAALKAPKKGPYNMPKSGNTVQVYGTGPGKKLQATIFNKYSAGRGVKQTMSRRSFSKLIRP